MENQVLGNVLLSIAVTWGILLLPPIVIRAVARKPLKPMWSKIVCAGFVLINFLVFIILESKSKSHLVVFIGAIVSNYILTWHTNAQAKNENDAERKALGYTD